MVQDKTYKKRHLVARAVAQSPSTLLEVLCSCFGDEFTRTRLKLFLKNRCVTLRGTPTTQFDASVFRGNAVEVYNIGFPAGFSSPFATLLWEDEDFLMFEKKVGIATVSNHPGLRNTLFRLAADYVKAYDPSNKIFLLNRLDSETSGLILFARNREVQQQILSAWRQYIREQKFVAVVEGLFDQQNGELKGKLRSKRDVPDTSKPLTRRSKTSYRVIEEGEYSTLAEFTLHGRFNGIRTLLQEEGMPVLGEKIPTAIFKNLKGLLLCQTSFTFRHPKTLEQKVFKLPIPEIFVARLRKPLTRSEKETARKQSILGSK